MTEEEIEVEVRGQLYNKTGQHWELRVYTSLTEDFGVMAYIYRQGSSIPRFHAQASTVEDAVRAVMCRCYEEIIRGTKVLPKVED